jgi:hypothetical protein
MARVQDGTRIAAASPSSSSITSGSRRRRSMMTAASYGARCGEKRAAYLERMGTIMKQ